MRFEQLDEEQIPEFMAFLQEKMVWDNGLVGRESYRYDGRHFICEMSDAREPYLQSHLTHYTADEFVTFLEKKRFPDHVLAGLLKQLAKWQSAHG